jgi:2',3'-cyclic-nucleotide 2'-phosphodiesterase (5'-nucleotidase family)
MNHKFLRVLVLLCFIFAAPFLPAAQKHYLTILHTNDTHSTLFPYGPHDDWGGIARVATLIKEIKAGTPNVLVLNAGDVFVGTFEFNKYLGYAELKIMEGMYDAMCLGNHEFDLGVEPLLGILSGALAGGEPAALPILCANVNLAGVPPLQQMVKPYMVKQVGDIKVGLIGVVNYDALNYSPEVYDLLSDPFEAAGQAAFMLKFVEGVDIVVCLSHLGKMYDVMGLSLVPGIDIIVGGHTHDAITGPTVVNGKIIAQAGEFGRYLGQVVVEWDGSEVRLVSQRLQPVNWQIKQDPALRPTLNMLRNGIVMDPRFGPVYSRHIATAPWDLEERWDLTRPERDTPLGNLVADGIKRAVADAGFPVDIALEANGYTAYKIHKGKVVGNDILKAIPYGYDEISGLGFKLDTVLLAGAQILAGLEYSVSMVEYTDDASMQVSGLTFEYDSSKSSLPGEQIIDNLTRGIMEWGRIDPFSIKVNGIPLDLNGTYWVALTEQLHRFLLANGLDPFVSISTGILEYNAVRDFMAGQKTLNCTIEGRVIDRSVASGPGAFSKRDEDPMQRKDGAFVQGRKESNNW